MLIDVFVLNGFKVFKTTSAKEVLKVFDEYKDKVDSMLKDGKIAEDRSS